ncbi:hypothetical protein [Syntrophomonas wolfei]|uniref:hypothetical protein n=1 Tax=Syntrophomonas wolfei TaxID=863 RepID=UPI0023F2C263|nr:hypothetical protein [Syntrophomonas wolfei]
MKTENLIRETLKGLLATAIEKDCVLGEKDPLDDLKQIRDMYAELVRFWDLDEDLIGEFDEKIGLLK